MPDFVHKGASLRLIITSSEVPSAFKGVVESTGPLVIRLQNDPCLAFSQSVIVMFDHPGGIEQIATKIVSCRPHGDGWLAQCGDLHFLDSGRRRFPRYRLDQPVALLPVGDAKDTYSSPIVGEMRDISLVGAWVATPTLFPVGTVLQWRANLGDGHTYGGLAVVVRASREEGGVAIEFIDLSSEARNALLADLAPRLKDEQSA